ncbi:type II toxin-antitoxin system HicB family antitoxin [Neorhizobium galegae]|uniref:type II toxin-antitoxin system HicB family antitoxin n=1 Tax=Neorhizobium galegae TaxID=399 RepID=UPI00210640B3|nr:type II toxin-antitoxin system HicB family antitoxin [Neorhizobium galegae]MCQ1833946.1 type II toxin-antitoxin system HicB family antitoxin [Neorhizobium galegae]
MNLREYKGQSGVVEFDAEDEIFVGHIAGIADLVGFHAKTVTDLETAFHEAVDDYLEILAKAAG